MAVVCLPQKHIGNKSPRRSTLPGAVNAA